MKRFSVLILFAALLAPVAALSAGGVGGLPYVGPSHDRFTTLPREELRSFEAFLSSFDSRDDDDGDGAPDLLGVPQWVAYEVGRFSGDCVPTGERPAWFTDKGLFEAGLAPKDDSYKIPKATRERMTDGGIDRGHLCPKFLAARMSPEAEYNTHTLLNAVPQYHEFNAGIWLDLERLTGAWAQRFGRVWVVTGPVFYGKPKEFIGEGKEKRVAVPDALFKIVAREGAGEKPEALAFIYPQRDPSYGEKPYRHEKYLTTVDEVERLTGLDFLTLLPDESEKAVESARHASLWATGEGDFVRECRGSQ